MSISAFRSFNNHELAQRFPQLRLLKLFSRSIQHITSHMFEHFNQLEYLILNGITTIENEAFFNLLSFKRIKSWQKYSSYRSICIYSYEYRNFIIKPKL